MKDDMGEVCSTHEEMRNAYNILIGKPEGRRPHTDAIGGIILKWISMK
jgi:hypothetical protein